MVEMLQILVFSVLFIWLSAITYILFKTRNHFQNLTSGGKHHNLDEILDTLITDERTIKHEIEDIIKETKRIGIESKTHFQKMGIVRFNPFGRAGSDQSFVLALLNAENNGIVINFIYTHEGVRVYTKRVKEGKGVGHDLTDEEKKAVDTSVSN